MRRREFITLLGAAVLPGTVCAQTKVHRLGFLGVTSASSWASRFEAFQSGLREVGYDPGKSILIDAIWAEEQYDRLPVLAADLVRRKVDIILTYGTPGTLAAKRATTEIPIVFAYAGDAVGAGLVSNLPRPEANVTGNTYFLSELMVKRLELLKEVLPDISRVGALVSETQTENDFKPYEAPARALKIQLQLLKVREPNPDIDRAFQTAAKGRASGLITITNPLLLRYTKRIAALALKHQFPSMYEGTAWVEDGGLMSFSTDDLDVFRRLATFVDKILKGARPADLPVEQPTKFELAINLKTARQIGLTIPPHVLARADRVIK